MLGKIVGILFGAARWALAIVGALVVALVVWLSSGGKHEAAPKIEPLPAVMVPVEQLPAAAVPVESCDCGAGAPCTGPRGGRYCIKPNGKKQYL